MLLRFPALCVDVTLVVCKARRGVRGKRARTLRRVCDEGNSENNCTRDSVLREVPSFVHSTRECIERDDVRQIVL